MDIMYKWVIVLGILLIAGISFLLLKYNQKRMNEFSGGLRAANTQRIRSSELYTELFKQYRIVRTILIAGLILCMLTSVVLISRPYKTKDVVNGVKKRDIILCLDVSYSLYDQTI